MIHCLYKTTNTINGRFYVGVHSTDDVGFGTDTWTDPYVGSGKLVQRALKKYGRNAFRVKALACFDTADDAYCAEAQVITEDWLLQNHGLTYNQMVGGDRPPSHKGFIWINNGSTEQRINQEQPIPLGWSKGRSAFSEKTKCNISEGLKRKWKGHLSDEHCRKISVARIGIVFSEQHRQNLSLSCKGRKVWNKGKHFSAKTRQKMREAALRRHGHTL